jgi:acetyl-CoA carboxylase biotin carboxyl carrier protein
MNFDEIKDLIKLVSKTGLGKVKIEKEDFQITISGNKNGKAEQPIIVQSPQPTMMAAPALAPASESAPETSKEKPAKSADDNLVTVNSPMIGTFYRSSGPDKDAFVNVGTKFNVGDKLCIIEAMKTFNEIEAEISGKIVKVLVDDASPVDYDQPLFMVEPV